MKDDISEQIDKKTHKNNKIAQPKTTYVVLELAYHDDYLSGVDVVGVFMDKHKANRIASGIGEFWNGKINAMRIDNRELGDNEKYNFFIAQGL